MRPQSCNAENTHEEAGIVIVLMAVSVIALLTVGGLALDAGKLFHARMSLQNAADAAVLSGVDYVVRTTRSTIGKEIDDYNKNKADSDEPLTISKYVYDKISPLARFNMAKAGYPHQAAPYEVDVKGPQWERTLPNGTVEKHETFTLEDAGQNDVFTVSIELSRDIDLDLMHYFSFKKRRKLSAYAEAGRKVANVAVMFDVSESMNCPALKSCKCMNNAAFGNPYDCTAADISGDKKIDYLENGLKRFLEHFDLLRDRILVVPFNIRANVFSVKDFFTMPDNVPLSSEEKGILKGIVSLIRLEYQEKNYLSEDTIDRIVKYAKVMFSKKPNGLTNFCDAFQRTWDFILADDNNLGMKGNEISYVLFTDGAPTAGRFLFANPKNTLAAWPSSDTYDYTHYEYKWVNDTFNVAAPGILVQTDMFTLGHDSPYPPLQNTGETDIGERSAATWANCGLPEGASTSNPSSALQPVYNLVQANEAAEKIFSECLNDMSFKMPKDIDGETPTEVYGDDYKEDGSNTWTDWRKLYYNCAIQLSDHLRDQRGVFYVIGLGEAAKEPEEFTPADPYQNLNDTVSVKTALLRRIANDQYKSTRAADPAPAPVDFDYSGYQDFDAISSDPSRQGTFLHAQTVSEIEDLFELIAQRILMKLYK